MERPKETFSAPRTGGGPDIRPDRPRARIQAALALSAGIGSAGLAVMGLFLFLGPLWSWGSGLGPGGRLGLDTLLCLAFFAVHSGLLRRPVRERLGGFVPRELQPALYAFVSGLFILVLVFSWQPLDPAFRLSGPARIFCRLVFLLALAGFLWTGWSLDGLDALGLKSGRGYLRGRRESPPRMAVRGPYLWVRHPFYLFALAMLWSQPDLSADRLLLNLLFTAWIVAGTFWEERDLLRLFGEDYRRYRELVPRLFPARLKPAPLGGPAERKPVP